MLSRLEVCGMSGCVDGVGRIRICEEPPDSSGEPLTAAQTWWEIALGSSLDWAALRGIRLCSTFFQTQSLGLSGGA